MKPLAHDDDTQAGKLRIDKWLWAARFFKTRANAADAVAGGKVHVNDERVKPARCIGVGDTLTITRGPYEFVVRVRALSARRGPAAAAALLYAETEASEARRAQLAEQLRAQPTIEAHGRPSKKARRDLLRFRRGGG